MAELANARIDQLPQNAVLKGSYYFPIRNMDNSITERVLLSEILPSTTSGNFEWISDHPYFDEEVVTYQGEWYQANGDIAANIVPGTNPAWVLISKSPSGFVYWQAGVFPQDDVFVLYDLSGVIGLYQLVNPLRPYVSVNFETELAAGDWKLLFSSGGGSGGGILEKTWKFSTIITTADPGAEFFRANNSVIASITALYFSQTASNNFDAAALFGLLEIDQRILIQQSDDATRIIEFKITALPTDNGTWWTVPVVVVDSNNLLFIDTKPCTVLFDLSISNALDTWPGSTHITTLGIVTTGVWNGTRLTSAHVPQGAALSVWGVSGNVTADQASIIGVADQILRVNGAGNGLGFGAIDLSKPAAVGSSVLGVANGGTGTATQPWWSLNGTTTLTGVATITSNVANQHVYTGTWTATANNQYHETVTSTITARATASDTIITTLRASTLVASASNQYLVDLDINPAFSHGAFNTTELALRMQSGSALMGSAASNVSRNTYRLELIGFGTTTSSAALGIYNSANQRLLATSDDGQIFVGNFGGPSIATQNSGSRNISGQGFFFNCNFSNNATNRIAYYFTSNSITENATATTYGMIITFPYAPTAGANDFQTLLIRPNINQTGTATGYFAGFIYDPILTAVLGINYAFISSSGRHGLGIMTPAAKLHVKGDGTTTGTLLRLDDNANTNRVFITDAGNVRIGTTSGTFNEKLCVKTIASDQLAGFFDAQNQTSYSWALAALGSTTSSSGMSINGYTNFTNQTLFGMAMADGRTAIGARMNTKGANGFWVGIEGRTDYDGYLSTISYSDCNTTSSMTGSTAKPMLYIVKDWTFSGSTIGAFDHTGPFLEMRNANNLFSGDYIKAWDGTNTKFKVKSNGQVAIGTAAPHASSLLDITSTTKGFLPPRMTGAQAEAISGPAEGLLIYSTDNSGTTITSKGWWGYDGTTWNKLN